MPDDIDNGEALGKVLDFTEFFLNLGDMKGTDMLIAIAERDPEFTYYFETVNDRCETVMDFFRLYGQWAVSRLKTAYSDRWDDILTALARSARYQMLSRHWKDTTALWEELEGMMGK